MDDRSNTIAGWVLGGGIVALGLTIASGLYFKPHEEKQGYAIQGVESSEGGAAAAAVPIATLLATADVAKGETIFKKCVACHSIAQGGANGIGPNLWATLGEGVGQGKAGYPFSDALKSKGGVWGFENLNEWLANPKKFAPGNKMTFAGLGNPEDRAAVMLYLNSQGSNLPLPAAPAAGAAAPAATPPADGAAPAAGAAAVPPAGEAPAAPAPAK
jgi:cytochrome c